MHFAERFFKLMHFVLVASAQTGEDAGPWSQVYGDLDALVKAEEARPLPPGFTDEDRSATLAPVLLWIDEAFLNSARPDAQEWYDHSLQRRFFDTNQGGELFFRRLEGLLARRRELFEVPDIQLEPRPDPLARMIDLWIRPGQGPDPLESQLDAYALCLVLGYRGRMWSEAPEKTEALMDLARGQLESWTVSETPKPKARKRRSCLAVLAGLWRDHGWMVVHLALPAMVTFFLWLRFREIVGSLPF